MRLLQKPKDYSYEELKSLLSVLGYQENMKGKSSGSRVAFLKDGYSPILLHRPHHPPYVKQYLINELITRLKESGEIDE